jgi:hypothetical protein
VPSNIVSPATVICTRNGWIEVVCQEVEIKCLGADRFGRISEGTIVAQGICNSERTVRFATGGAFGVFSSSTALLEKDGKHVVLGRLTRNGDVTNHWFEHLSLSSFEAAGPKTSEIVWASLSDLRPDGVSGPTVIRLQREPSAAKKELRELGLDARHLQFRQVRTTAFAVVAPEEFRDSCTRDWASTVAATGVGAFRNPRDGQEELPVGLEWFGAWYLWSLRKLGMGYEVNVDSLQYTSLWYVRDAAAKAGPFFRGKCSFLGQQDEPAVRISWSHRRWVPILSGFISGTVSSGSGVP